MKKILPSKSALKKVLTRFALMAFTLLGLMQGANAQTVLVGSNTGTSNYFPLPSNYGYSYSQSIYLASEVTAAGGSGPAYISEIKYYYASSATPVSNWNQWDIYMANTAQASYTTSTWISGLSPVFSGTVSIPPTAGQWITIPLATPFLWDGTSNIVIAVDENSPGYTSSTATWQSTTPTLPDYRSLLYYNNYSNPSASSPPAPFISDNTIPDIQLTLLPTTPCAGAPSTGTASASSASVCTGTPFNLDLSNFSASIGYSYQWQSSPNNSTWTNFGLASNHSFLPVSGIAAGTYYRCAVTCTASGQSTNSAPVLVSLNTPINCYCMPGSPGYVSTCTNDHFTDFSVANVSLQGSNCDLYGFSDSTGSHYTSVNLNAGQAYTLTVHTQISQGTGNGAQGAWIDFDQNRMFDAGEFISLGYGASGTYTASFTVPLTAPAGAVRMRLKLEVWYANSYTVVDACSNSNNPGNIGQVIDYKVNITPAPACSGAPNAGNAVSTVSTTCSSNPFVLDLSNTSISLGLQYQWQSSPNGTTWASLGALQGTTAYTINTQSAGTYYRCVVTCTNSSLTSTSTPVTVNQTPFMSCYCTPQNLLCSNGDNFSSVVFQGINDAPVCNANGYVNNTAAATASVSAGQSYTMTTVIGNSTYSHDYVGAWIDYDHSGSFEVSEFTLLGAGSNTTISGPISIPFTAAGGLTYMRVRAESSYNAAFQQIDPCVAITSGYGETVDYSVYITPSPACSGSPVAGNAISSATAVCPNVSYTLDLSGEGQVSGATYQWQSSPNGSTWTNLGASQTTVPYSVAGQTVTTYYRCVVTCVASSQSSNSGAVTVLQNPPTACYCTNQSFYCSNSAIGNFVFQTINDSPTCTGNGYINNTGTYAPPPLSANQTYTAMLAVSTNSPGLYHIAGAWLDFDANGIFDVGEYFFFGSGTGTSITYTTSISIPFTAVGGLTRMRVQEDAGFSPLTSQDPCYSVGSAGMSIDYLVNITPVPACAAAPASGTATANSPSVCPSTDVKLNLTGSSVASAIKYQWQSSLNGVSWTNLGAAQSTVPYEVFTQTVTTHYRCVLTCTSVAMTATSVPVIVGINSPTVCYCVNPATNCSNNDNIINVILANLTNTSTCSPNGYADYTSTVPSATVAAGVTYTLITQSSNMYGEYVSAWIDFDHNGVFDPLEYTYIGYSNSTNDTIQGPITIPVNALTGTARMRVRLFNGMRLTDTAACVNPSPPLRTMGVGSAYGETEDYLVTITPPNCNLLNFQPGMAATASSATVCTGSNDVFDLATPIQPATGLTYQWENSLAGVSYTSVGAPLSTSSLTTPVPQSAYYRCIILCNTIPVATSGTVFVTAVSPTVTAAANPSVICAGETTTLSAGGGVSYSWSTGAAAATTTASAVSNTVYTVTGTNASGCMSTATVSLLVNASTAIGGTVTTTPGNVAGIVILYKYEPFLVKFDSVNYTNILANGAYNFPSVNSATFIVKAVPSASSLQITYAPNVISWQSAAPFTHSCVASSITNIQVQPYTTLAAGTGSLSGRITEGPGYIHKGFGQKPEAPGNPIPGVVVKGGKNPGAAIFAQTTTDAGGNYAFNNLPINASNEDYFILVDIPGLDTNGTYHKQITAAVNSYDSLNFVVDNQYVNPVQNNTTSINTLHIADNNIRVFPNPASSSFTISYSLLRQSNVRIELLDVVGKTVKHIQPAALQAAGDYAQPVPVDLLGQGMYFVKIYVNSDEATVKLFITN